MNPLRRALQSILIFPLGGALWGLALARALAESWPASPTFALLPSLLLALAAAALAVLGQRRFAPNPSALVPLLLSIVYVFWPAVAPRVGWTLLGGSLALTALLLTNWVPANGGESLSPKYGTGRASLPNIRVHKSIRQGQATKVLPYALAALCLALYLRTLGPTVGQADTFEFQVIAPTWGVAHPTGYPLYILCGKLFSLLPLGSVAWRVNLTSAVFATVAILLLYYVGKWGNWKVGKWGSREMGALAALALAFSRVFWSQAVVAEVYALHNLFVAAILLLLINSLSAPRASRLSLLALLLGLSFANHLTTLLLLPAVGLTLLLARPRLEWRPGKNSVWTAAGLFLLGLSLYLYIYFRWPALHDGVWMSWGEFWRYITGQQFGGALRLEAWYTDRTRYEILWRLLREPFGWPGLVLSAIGLAWLALKSWRVALVTGVTFAAFAWYALCYYVPDVSVFLLPAHLLLALWLGAGLAALARLHPQAYPVVLTLGALLPLGLLWTNLPLVDQSGEREAYAWGERVLELPLAPNSAILADSARIAPLYYLQHIEGRRPDMDMLVLPDEAAYRAELETRLAAGQTMYLARFLPGLEARYHLRSVGPLTEVSTAPLPEPPALDLALDASFGPIELLGITGPAPGPGGGSGLTLYWRAESPVGQVYHVRLRLVDQQGQVWWQEDGGHAANNYYPTLAWRPGEVVADYHEIPPLPTAPAGDYTLQAGWFRPFSDEGLTTAQDAAWYSIMPFDAPPGNLPPPEHPLNARFGSGPALLGADLADVFSAGSPVELTLHWEDAAPGGSPALAWTDSQGQYTPAQVLQNWGGARFLIQAPTLPGEYGLRLGWVDEDGQPLAARCGWLARASDDCALATVRVTEAAQQALANFDSQMLLLEAETSASTLHPGQSTSLILHWRALRPIEEDYTVSVQFVGPDGRLYGQTDAWPVQGTLPTSLWSPGQSIYDPYGVILETDAPPGRYQVGVVVYLLATNTRLPLLDNAGQIIGDMAVVGEFDVAGE